MFTPHLYSQELVPVPGKPGVMFVPQMLADKVGRATCSNCLFWATPDCIDHECSSGVYMTLVDYTARRLGIAP